MFERLALERQGPSPIRAEPKLSWPNLAQPVDYCLKRVFHISYFSHKELKKIVSALLKVLFQCVNDESKRSAHLHTLELRFYVPTQNAISAHPRISSQK